MSEPFTALGMRALLEWICTCDSPGQIHSTIRAWLAANPPPGAGEQGFGWTDDVPDGYEPPTSSPVFNELAQIAARIVRESGPPGAAEEFDARRWISEWVRAPHPALGGKTPLQVLHTSDGVEQVRRLLEQQQSGAYA
jgi:hypothetical protein